MVFHLFSTAVESVHTRATMHMLLRLAADVNARQHALLRSIRGNEYQERQRCSAFIRSTLHKQRTGLSLPFSLVSAHALEYMQIGIGMIVATVTFVPSLLLVQLFRRTQPRQATRQTSPLQKTLNEIKQCEVPYVVTYGMYLSLSTIAQQFHQHGGVHKYEEDEVGAEITMVVSVRGVRSLVCAGSRIDILHHCSWYRIRRFENTEMVDIADQWILLVNSAD